MSGVVDTFLELTRIDSPSGREGEVASHLTRVFEDAGCEVHVDDSAAVTGSDTGNVIVCVPGTVPGKVIALSAHMDCVQPCEGVEPVLEDGVVRSAGQTVLGADDKAGLAAMIELVRRLAASDTPHADIRLLITVGEETGLLGAKALTAEACAADVCLVLDGDGPVGGIVTAAPTHYTFRAAFRGRAAHAGVEPEKGSSAIAMAASAIQRMALGRLDEQTTANIGTISGGRATNVVAPSCEVTGECRSRDAERIESVREAMDTALKDAAAEGGGEVEVEWTLEYRGFSAEEDSSALLLIEHACRDIGVEPRRFATGGGSDANVISVHGVPTFVLSSGMTSVHSIDECIAVCDLEALVDLLEAVARRAVG